MLQQLLDLCSAFSTSLKFTLYTAHSNTYVAYKIALCLTFTKCERTFSKLMIVKNRLRSLLGQEHLESVMLINVETDDKIEYDEIMNSFAKTSKLLICCYSVTNIFFNFLLIWYRPHLCHPPPLGPSMPVRPWLECLLIIRYMYSHYGNIER